MVGHAHMPIAFITSTIPIYTRAGGCQRSTIQYALAFARPLLTLSDARGWAHRQCTK